MATPADLSGDDSPACGASVAAFDFDGTLVRGDSLRPFMIALLGPAGFTAALTRAVPRMGWAYRRGGRDQAKAALLARALAGVDAERARQVGVRFGATLAGRVKPPLLERITWHRAQGHRLILVSASLDLYLDEFGRRTGFDRVIATRLATSVDGPGAVLTGALLGANVRAGEKETRLRAELGPGPVELWAYGDSAGDREMLAMADHPFRVDGTRLVAATD